MGATLKGLLGDYGSTAKEWQTNAQNPKGLKDINLAGLLGTLTNAPLVGDALSGILGLVDMGKGVVNDFSQLGKDPRDMLRGMSKSTGDYASGLGNLAGVLPLVPALGGVMKPTTMFHKTAGDIVGEVKTPFFVSPSKEFVNTRIDGGAIYPINANVSNTFDYENSNHVGKLVDALYGKLPKNVRDEQISLLSKDFKPTESITGLSNWAQIEKAQKLIQDAGFDSMNVTEQGVKNMAIFDPKKVEFALSTAEKPMTEFEKAHEVARQNAVKMLGLPENNTAMDRAKALGFDLSGYHGTVEDVKAFDPKKYGMATNAPSAQQAAFIAKNPDGSMSGGAETASQYARLGDRTENALQREMASAEKRGNWDKYEELTQNLENYSYGKVNQASSASESREKYLDSLGILRDAYKLDVPPISDFMKFYGVDGIEQYRKTVMDSLDATYKGKDLGSVKNYYGKIIDSYKSSVVSGLDAEINHGANVMPLMVRSGKTTTKDFGGTPYRDESFNDVIARGFNDGSNSVVLKNTYDPGVTSGSFSSSPSLLDVVAVKDPSRIRSRFAAFDPARINSPDLLAGVGGLTLAGLLGTQLLSDDKKYY